MGGLLSGGHNCSRNVSHILNVSGSFLLRIGSFLLTIELLCNKFCLGAFLVTCNWSFFTYNCSSLLAIACVS